MSELSTQARSIVDAARELDGPTAQDRERVRHALMGAVSGAVAATGTSAPAANVTTLESTWSLSVLGKVFGALVLCAGAAGLAWVLGGHVGPGGDAGLEPIAKPAAAESSALSGAQLAAPGSMSAPVERGSSRLVPTGPVTEAAGPVTEAAPVPSPPPSAVGRSTREGGSSASQPTQARRRQRRRPTASPSAPALAPSAPPAGASLSEELLLVRGAQSARRSGDRRRALMLLSQHASRFPDGLLAAERDAARVFVLCDSGRAPEATAAARAFSVAHPGSPLLARVAAACEGAQ